MSKLSERIETYPNGLSVFWELSSEMAMLAVGNNWPGVCGLPHPLPNIRQKTICSGYALWVVFYADV